MKIMQPKFKVKATYPVEASNTTRYSHGSKPTGVTPNTTYTKLAEIECIRKTSGEDCFSSSDEQNKIEECRFSYVVDYNWGSTYDEATTGTTQATPKQIHSGRRMGQRITLSNEAVWHVGMLLRKYGTPTGTAYVRVRKVSDDSIVGQDSIDVSTLTTTLTWYDFKPQMTSKLSEDVRICIEFAGGDGSNYVVCAENDGTGTMIGDETYYGGSSWIDYSTEDAYLKIKYRLQKYMRPYVNGVAVGSEYSWLNGILNSEAGGDELDLTDIMPGDTIELWFKVEDSNTEDNDTVDVDNFDIKYDWDTTQIKGDFNDL